MSEFMIHVTDPKHPGRIGWIGVAGQMVGRVPKGLAPFRSRDFCNVTVSDLRRRFPRAEIQLIELKGQMTS